MKTILMTKGLRPLHRWTCALAAVLFSSAALAGYPERTVTLVVPFTPGSGSDIISRIIAPRLSELWKQPVVVDNKPGASGTIGAAAVAKATPDGYTLLMAISTLAMAPNLYKQLPFNPVTDFTPVMKMASAHFALVVNPKLAANDLPGFLALAKARSDQISYGSPGKGTPHHLGMELMQQQQGFKMLHVPYRGISNATTDLIGGQVEIMFASVHSMLPHVKAGRLKMLALANSSRSSVIPNVPTFREFGMPYMEALDSWYALLGPAKMSGEIVKSLHRDFSTVLAMPEVKEQMSAQGLSLKIGSPEQLGELVKSDFARWGKTIENAKIPVD